MATHVAILMKRYLRLILSGEKTVESRLTKTSRAPFGVIAPGDRIYFKASSGPYMATAIADKVASYDNLTPAKLRDLKKRYNPAVCGEDAFWDMKSDSNYATFINLRNVEPTNEGPKLKPSTGIAWFVVEEQQPMQVKLTDGALRNRYVRAPKGMTGDITLALPDGKRIDTQVDGKGLIRWRGWGPYFAGLKPGAVVTLSPRGAIYHVTLPAASPVRTDYITNTALKKLVTTARDEDLGPSGRDITSDTLVPKALKAEAVMRSRDVGVLCGAALFDTIAKAYDPAITIEHHLRDGDALAKGSQVATFRGSLRSILAMERIALNFATHLSGIASQTARYVKAAGNKAGIYDTRKTLPGLRALEKYAVACGGGRNHRIGLYDAVLVKDNHIAHLPPEALESALRQAIGKARKSKPKPTFIEIEVDTLEQLRHVLKLPIDMVLLDNMTFAQLREAVALRDKLAPKVELEASGGVTLRTVRAIAQTGVDRIAIGAITHSAASLDLGLDILQ